METITEQLDMAVSLPPAEQPPVATAHSVTLTDTDVATATANVSIVNGDFPESTKAEYNSLYSKHNAFSTQTVQTRYNTFKYTFLYNVKFSYRFGERCFKESYGCNYLQLTAIIVKL